MSLQHRKAEGCLAYHNFCLLLKDDSDFITVYSKDSLRFLGWSCSCCSLLQRASRQGRDLVLEELLSPGPDGRVLPVVEGKERREEVAYTKKNQLGLYYFLSTA